jgi:hypothetical protein
MILDLHGWLVKDFAIFGTQVVAIRLIAGVRLEECVSNAEFGRWSGTNRRGIPKWHRLGAFALQRMTSERGEGGRLKGKAAERRARGGLQRGRAASARRRGRWTGGEWWMRERWSFWRFAPFFVRLDRLRWVQRMLLLLLLLLHPCELSTLGTTLQFQTHNSANSSI